MDYLQKPRKPRFYTSDSPSDEGEGLVFENSNNVATSRDAFPKWTDTTACLVHSKLQRQGSPESTCETAWRIQRERIRDGQLDPEVGERMLALIVPAEESYYSAGRDVQAKMEERAQRYLSDLAAELRLRWDQIPYLAQIETANSLREIQLAKQESLQLEIRLAREDRDREREHERERERAEVVRRCEEKARRQVEICLAQQERTVHMDSVGQQRADDKASTLATPNRDLDCQVDTSETTIHVLPQPPPPVQHVGSRQIGCPTSAAATVATNGNGIDAEEEHRSDGEATSSSGFGVDPPCLDRDQSPRFNLRGDAAAESCDGERRRCRRGLKAPLSNELNADTSRLGRDKWREPLATSADVANGVFDPGGQLGTDGDVGTSLSLDDEASSIATDVVQHQFDADRKVGVGGGVAIHPHLDSGTSRIALDATVPDFNPNREVSFCEGRVGEEREDLPSVSSGIDSHERRLTTPNESSDSFRIEKEDVLHQPKGWLAVGEAIAIACRGTRGREPSSRVELAPPPIPSRDPTSRPLPQRDRGTSDEAEDPRSHPPGGIAPVNAMVGINDGERRMDNAVQRSAHPNAPQPAGPLSQPPPPPQTIKIVNRPPSSGHPPSSEGSDSTEPMVRHIPSVGRASSDVSAVATAANDDPNRHSTTLNKRSGLFSRPGKADGLGSHSSSDDSPALALANACVGMDDGRRRPDCAPRQPDSPDASRLPRDTLKKAAGIITDAPDDQHRHSTTLNKRLGLFNYPGAADGLGSHPSSDDSLTNASVGTDHDKGRSDDSVQRSDPPNAPQPAGPLSRLPPPPPTINIVVQPPWRGHPPTYQGSASTEPIVRHAPNVDDVSGASPDKPIAVEAANDDQNRHGTKLNKQLGLFSRPDEAERLGSHSSRECFPANAVVGVGDGKRRPDKGHWRSAPPNASRLSRVIPTEAATVVSASPDNPEVTGTTDDDQVRHPTTLNKHSSLFEASDNAEELGSHFLSEHSLANDTVGFNNVKRRSDSALRHPASPDAPRATRSTFKKAAGVITDAPDDPNRLFPTLNKRRDASGRPNKPERVPQFWAASDSSPRDVRIRSDRPFFSGGDFSDFNRSSTALQERSSTTGAPRVPPFKRESSPISLVIRNERQRFSSFRDERFSNNFENFGSHASSAGSLASSFASKGKWPCRDGQCRLQVDGLRQTPGWHLFQCRQSFNADGTRDDQRRQWVTKRPKAFEGIRTFERRCQQVLKPSRHQGSRSPQLRSDSPSWRRGF